MTATAKKRIELDRVVIRFVGDSGDGMQLTGSQFTYTSAMLGNDIATLPDFPAEIRAPQGTMEGVSGFQVQIGAVDIHTPGDEADVLVAMNPAALRANLKWLRQGGHLIVDMDDFEGKNLKRAGYDQDPLDDGSLDGYSLTRAPITSLTKEALKGVDLSTKGIVRCKNMFALGIVYWLFNRDPERTLNFIAEKFRKDPALIEANTKALQAGYFYAETVEALPSSYEIAPALIAPGTYRHIAGNQAIAWGLMAAAERLGSDLFFGSYPITPASDILHELTRHRGMGVLAFQAEDEIAAVCSAIGAAFAGQLAVTASSGPGIALKGEGMGLAVMAELPLVIVDVQRAGPSTGLPTKTEQADLNIALHGRNGESPAIVLAARSPAQCFEAAYMAAKLAIEHMTPVILLSDGYLANGTEPWRIPNVDAMPDIKRQAPPADVAAPFQPYLRDPATLSRYWAVPGTPGLEHRIGGLEKADVGGDISYDPMNHQKMVDLRAEKVARVADHIPAQGVRCEQSGKVLVVGWGGTYGSLLTAVTELEAAGESVGLAHFEYLNPLPANTEDVLSRFEHVLVCELNSGQFARYLKSLFPEHRYHQLNKVQGLPFRVNEVKDKIMELCHG
ncbi:MAG: 2-oxoacid:acceptor oxidoreductase subunit alpha [Gammaproteobacteria bacterium]|jgi:2-oxoglutarate ferredoxin oxidoreductase subunit alpha|nr:2-oxoacid:acceptor oxidoreductase subunit alpha [Gammaproteobacteria bacterium]